MSYQYSFPFAVEDEFGEFIVSISNQLIIDFLKKWPDWGTHPFSTILLINGPRRSGKTHLLSNWKSIFNAKIININSTIEELRYDTFFYLEDLTETLDSEKEKRLLHIINYLNETKKYLIITSSHKLNQIKISLPDLESRFRAINYLEIGECDDNLFSVLLYKHLVKYNLRPSIEIMRYIEQKLDRSYEKVENFACKLNEISLKEMRRPSISLVRQIMEMI